MNFILRVGRTWDTQIAAIRNAVTEDTNLIRYDNTFYRICSNALPPSFTVSVLPSTVSPPLVLNMRTRDLYVELIGGHPFENYSHNLDRMPFEATATSGEDAERGFARQRDSRPAAHTGRRQAHAQARRPLPRAIACRVLRGRIAAVRQDRDRTRAVLPIVLRPEPSGDRQFAERGRADPVPAFVAADGEELGKDDQDVFDGIPDKMREIVVQPRSRLSPADRQASARVDLVGFGDVTRSIAPGMRVLMRPS